jgi:hypothetical protein
MRFITCGYCFLTRLSIPLLISVLLSIEGCLCYFADRLPELAAPCQSVALLQRLPVSVTLGYRLRERFLIGGVAMRKFITQLVTLGTQGIYLHSLLCL